MRRTSLVIFLLLMVLVVAGTWFVGATIASVFEGYVAEPVWWTNGDVELSGSLYWPDGDAPHAAAVFIPGHGDWTRDGELFRVHAKRMAERGIALLLYDKRGCGESTGDWRSASLADLAEDALGGLRVLRAQEWIDPDRRGLFGTSQGGAIAVIAASRSADVSFVATLSLSTRSPADHDNFIVGARLREEGYGEAEIARATQLHREILEIHRTGVGWEELAGQVQAARGEAWFADAQLDFPPPRLVAVGSVSRPADGPRPRAAARRTSGAALRGAGGSRLARPRSPRRGSPAGDRGGAGQGLHRGVDPRRRAHPAGAPDLAAVGLDVARRVLGCARRLARRGDAAREVKHP